MLVLTRRAHEKIVCTTASGEVIEVAILAVNGAQVRVGVNAPRDVIIDREEIDERKKRERQAV